MKRRAPFTLATPRRTLKQRGMRDEVQCLSETELAQLCDRLAGHLENWNLIGMLMLLVSHVVFSEDPEDSMLMVQKYLILHNAHGRDQAIDFLLASALETIRRGAA